MEPWDAIVVGAGPAGCAAAWDLAAAGRAVLLLDKAEFPRHKACAGGLTRKSLRALRYSVTPVVRETVSAIVIKNARDEAATLASRNAICAMTVRQELDEFCLRQTLGVGAQFARIAAIAGIEGEADGVVVRTPETEYRGRFLVGADGVHSRVRQLLCADPGWFRRGFALEAEVRREAGNPTDLVFDLAPVRQGYGWIFPKRDHVNVGLYTESSEEKLDRPRLERYIRERLGEATLGPITGQYLGFGAERGQPDAARIFLVGDAGGFADPLTGEGIYGAIASGQAAAAAIDGELRGGIRAQEAFAKKTAPLRRDLLLSASGARWFYGNLDLGYRALTAPVFRRAVINAYANGTRIAALANAVRRFARIFAMSA
ncbi:MAG TPA: geranylgeranyl reductase family protein [Acidobacteriaceae bacterium]|jgi:geranylgeranyl reductase family protein|nr:geranylgeranyl reductase family protein [Acidobacteriaceae bacterium]